MKKQDAIQAFGTPSKLARAIGITPQAVYQWPEELTDIIRDRVIAAAVREGIYGPKGTEVSDGTISV